MDTTLRDPLVGRVLDGRYRVESRVAVGGMATVYRATDTRLDRVLALKVMHPSLVGDEEFVARFIGEAKTAAKLSHANVVGVFDQGRDGDLVFLAMEYVDGCTLRDILRSRGALSARLALDILEPVVAALGAAHRAGLVHRDVKPENVLIGDDGRVKVADFGLVRTLSTTSAPTQAGTMLGTVAYLAPEQIDDGTVDHRSDVFACGLLLYEMLTGVRAQEGETAGQALYKRLQEPVPAPSERVPGLAGALDATVAATTARDPAQRPADAVELLATVQHLRRTLTAKQLDLEPGEQGGAVGRPAGGAEASDAATGPSAGGTQHTRVQQLPADLVMPRPPEEEPPPPATAAPRVRRWRPARPGRLALILTVSVLLIGGLAWWTLAGRYTQAPSLLGLSKTEAVSKARDAGLQVHFSSEFSESVRRDHVIRTKPAPHAQVDRGGTIRVALSKGPERHDVPKLKGKTLKEATQALHDRSLLLGKKTTAHSTSVDKRHIISSSPAAGRELKKNSAVDLVVSKGAPPVDVPDVVDDEVGTAQSALTKAGFRPVVSPKQEYSEDVEKGHIARQSPSDTAPKGSKVHLYVSKGEKTYPVPDVTGKKLDEAKRILSDAGFEPRAVSFPFGSQTVHNQNPNGGDRKPKGSTVTVYAF